MGIGVTSPRRARGSHRRVHRSPHATAAVPRYLDVHHDMLKDLAYKFITLHTPLLLNVDLAELKVPGG